MKSLNVFLMTSLVILLVDCIEILDITPFQVMDAGSDVELFCDLGLERGDDNNDWEVTWIRGLDMGNDGDVETAATAFISKDAIGQIGLIGDGYKASLSAGHGKDSLRWSLVLENANPDDTGLYQCKVSILSKTKDGKSQRTQRWQTRLKIIDGESIQHQMRYIITKKGEDVTLDCTDGDEKTEVNWAKHGENDVSHSGNSLSLIKVDRSDSGVYYCSVNGDGYKKRNVSLLVEHAPEVFADQGYLQHPGYPVTLMCHVSAVPPPVITWYRWYNTSNSDTEMEVLKTHDGIDISISNFTDGKITSSLLIDDVHESDFGQYICVAHNIHGMVNRSIELSFSSQPIVQYSGSSSGIFCKGSSRTFIGKILLCQVFLIILICYAFH